MLMNLGIQLLALPVCLRLVCTAAAKERTPSNHYEDLLAREPLLSNEASDPINQVFIARACPDYAHYARVRQ